VDRRFPQSVSSRTHSRLHNRTSWIIITIIIIIHAFITRADSVVVLNQRCWQSIGWQHGKSVDGLFEKVSFQTAFEGVESG